MMREAWDLRLRSLQEAAGLVVDGPVGADVPLIAPGLKVRHGRSQVRYTVSSVGPRDVILTTPEGEEFIVDRGELESSYELD